MFAYANQSIFERGTMKLLRVVEEFIDRTFSRYGLSLRRSDENKFVKLLAAHSVEVIFDVGANAGQFAKALRDNHFKGKIISFEPLRQAHQQLQERAQGDPLWDVYERCALGASEKRERINISKNSVSSSFLGAEEVLLNANPSVKYVDTEEVQIYTLDKIFDDQGNIEVMHALKIDTQGFELEVLKGAIRTISHFKVVIVEMSIEPIYTGSPRMSDIVDFLKINNFILWDLLPGFRDPTTKRLYQMDGVFLRFDSEY